MNRVKELLNSAQEVLNTTAIYYNYELSNITIKAEVVALLPVEIERDDEIETIEAVADVSQVDDYHFAVQPFEQEDLFAIAKAIKKEHPLFEIEEVEDCEEDVLGEVTTTNYLKIKMPDVDTDRRDSYLDFVDTQYEATEAQLKLSKTEYTAQITKELTSPTAEQLQQLEEKMQAFYDDAIKTCDDGRASKIEEIEAGYQKYLLELADSEEFQNSQLKSQQAATQFKMS